MVNISRRGIIALHLDLTKDSIKPLSSRATGKGQGNVAYTS